jgi:hypothetical protein
MSNQKSNPTPTPTPTQVTIPLYASMICGSVAGSVAEVKIKNLK